MTKLTVPDWILDNFTRLFLEKANLPESPFPGQLRGTYLPKSSDVAEKAQFVYKAPLETVLGKKHFNQILRFWKKHFTQQLHGVASVSPEKWFFTIYASVSGINEMLFSFTIALEDFPELTNEPKAQCYRDHSLARFAYSKIVETLPQAYLAIQQCLSESLAFMEKDALVGLLLEGRPLDNADIAEEETQDFVRADIEHLEGDAYLYGPL